MNNTTLRLVAALALVSGVLLSLGAKWLTPDLLARIGSSDGVLDPLTVSMVNSYRVFLAIFGIGAFLAGIAALSAPRALQSALISLKSHALSERGLSLAILLAGLAGTILIFLATVRYGIGVTSDSTFYISTAESLLRSGEFTSFTGAPFVHWPPLFPSLLMIGGLTGIPPLTVARLLNALTFGLVILAAGHILRNSLAQRSLALIGVLSLAVSIPLFNISVLALSEPLFVLLTLLFFIALRRYRERPEFQRLAALGGIAALAYLQRYLGVTLVLTGAVLVTFSPKPSGLRNRLFRAMLFCVTATFPVAIWLARNHHLTGTFMGWNTPPMRSLAGNSLAALDVLSRWFIPEAVPLAVRGMGFLCVLAVCAVLAARNTRLVSLRPAAREYLLPAGVFSLATILFLVLSSTFQVALTLHDRMFSPVYFPLLLFLLHSADSAFRPASGRGYRLLRTAFPALLVCSCLLYPLAAVSGQTARFIRDGAGASWFNTTEWRSSPLLGWLRENPLEGRIISNVPEAVYLSTGHTAVYANEHPLKLNEFRTDDFLNALASDGGNSLVWFTHTGQYPDFRPDDLRTVCRIRLVREFADGAVYEVEKE